MAKNGVIDSIDGLSVDQTLDPESINATVASVDKCDIVKAPRVGSRSNRPKLYKYVLGDRFELCFARDRHQAMLVFGALDAIRVDLVTISDEFVYSLFTVTTTRTSDYDGSIILQSHFK